MVLDFEYGINIGNRFLDLVDHDEDPDVFIANKTQPEEKQKKSTKDSKKEPTKSKPINKSETSSATPSSTKAASANTTKVNKENLTRNPSNNNQQQQQQRQQQTNTWTDNNNTQNNQQTRPDSGRGGRGFGRRGGSAGQDRPPREGFYRGGGGQQRPQRFNKFEGQQGPMETGTFEQNAEHWENQNQTHTGYRGRGGPRRGYYEGGRGAGRGRGRGGRGHPGNRTFQEGSQEQQQPKQENLEQQPIVQSNIDDTRVQSAPIVPGQDFDTNAPVHEAQFESNDGRRGRGHFRPRVFRSNRNYGGENQNEDEIGQKNFRHNRRQNDRQPRTFISGVKPVEKRQGEGPYNWGKTTDNPEEPAPVAETTDQAETAEPEAASAKGWAQQVDEAEKQMTLDEYRKQIEAKKHAQHEKVPQFNRRAPNEGEDPKTWQNFKHVYRKKNDDGESEEVVEEESEGEEENQSEEENDEQISGKKKVITIPLRFKPIEPPRGARGGLRRGSGRFRDRPYGDDRRRSNSPNQQQAPSSYQAGEHQNEEQQGKPYGGGSRQGTGHGEFRREFRNSARGGYNRSNTGPRAPDFANAADFPTLHKP